MVVVVVDTIVVADDRVVVDVAVVLVPRTAGAGTGDVMVVLTGTWDVVVVVGDEGVVEYRATDDTGEPVEPSAEDTLVVVAVVVVKGTVVGRAVVNVDRTVVAVG